VTCLSKLPHYLYLDPIVRLDVRDQMFKHTGNSFLSGALITIWYFRSLVNVVTWQND